MNYKTKLDFNQEELNKTIGQPFNVLKEKKELNLIFASEVEYIKTNIDDKIISITGLNNILSCGNYIESMATATFDKIKVTAMNSCKHRFCPRCAYLKSRRMAIKLLTTLEYIKQFYNLDVLFLTLTVVNCKKDEIRDTIKKMNKAFELLMKRKDIKAISKGHLRKMEVTYNEDDDTYHPHFHIMILVEKSYFKTNDYIKRDTWLELWQDCINDKRITQVDIRKMNTDFKDIQEMAKYETKASDYKTPEVLYALMTQLKGLKELQSSGLFTIVFKMYDNGELIEFMGTLIESNTYVYLVISRWKYDVFTYENEVLEYDGRYDNSKIDDLTELEKE